MKRLPFSRETLPSLNLPTRIFGPCRSHMMATVRPTLDEISLTSVARLRWSSAVPCEKFSRTTSTPARTMRSSTAGSDDAGPRVATILVLRSIFPSVSSCYVGSATSRCLPLRHLVQDLRRVPRHLRPAGEGKQRRALRLARRRGRQRVGGRHRDREFPDPGGVPRRQAALLRRHDAAGRRGGKNT